MIEPEFLLVKREPIRSEVAKTITVIRDDPKLDRVEAKMDTLDFRKIEEIDDVIALGKYFEVVIGVQTSFGHFLAVSIPTKVRYGMYIADSRTVGTMLLLRAGIRFSAAVRSSSVHLGIFCGCRSVDYKYLIY